MSRRFLSRHFPEFDSNVKSSLFDTHPEHAYVTKRKTFSHAFGDTASTQADSRLKSAGAAVRSAEEAVDVEDGLAIAQILKRGVSESAQLALRESSRRLFEQYTVVTTYKIASNLADEETTSLKPAALWRKNIYFDFDISNTTVGGNYAKSRKRNIYFVLHEQSPGASYQNFLFQ